MTRMTIDIPDDEHKRLKIDAINDGLSIKDYVLDAIRKKQKYLESDDGRVRILKKSTVKALEESRNTKKKVKKFSDAKEAIEFLDSL